MEATNNLTLDPEIFDLTSEQLNKMSMIQLKELAKSLGISITETRPSKTKLLQEVTECLRKQGTLIIEETTANDNINDESDDELPFPIKQRVKHTTGDLSEELKFKLELRKMELEMERENKRIEMERERESQRIEMEREIAREKIASQERIEIARSRTSNHSNASSEADAELYKFKKHIPVFEDNSVEEFFMIFERNARDYQFPEGKKAILLRSALNKGKALDVVLSLTEEELYDYELIKNRVLLSYALTPEKYRKVFRESKKEQEQSHVDFLRQKKKYFERWIRSKGVNKDFDKLANLMLMEDFNNNIRGDVRIHLADKGVEQVETAAVMADEYVIIHSSNKFTTVDKSKFQNRDMKVEKKTMNPNESYQSKRHQQSNEGPTNSKPTCSHCKRIGHTKEKCWILNGNPNKKNVVLSYVAMPKQRTHENVKKDIRTQTEIPSANADNLTKHTYLGNLKPEIVPEIETMVFNNSNSNLSSKESISDRTTMSTKHTSYKNNLDTDLIDTEIPSNCLPFIEEGTVSSIINGVTSEKNIRILRDTGAEVSLLLENTVPTSQSTYTGQDLTIQGVSRKNVQVPLHQIQLKSAYFTGNVVVGVYKSLPFKGVSLILGNDIAGDVVHSISKKKQYLNKSESFIKPICIVTRGMAQQQKSVETMSKSKIEPEIDLQATFLADILSGPSVKTTESNLSPRQLLLLEQNRDSGIKHLKKKVITEQEAEIKGNGFFLKEGILMQKWRDVKCDNDNCREGSQIVVPAIYRNDILHMAHDTPYAGHLGVNKTYRRILPYFYWPGLHRDVTKYCKSCNTCQIVGKPNQTIPVAPLKPIPAFAEPFSHLLIDCVGPLPKTKTGHQYLFTIMCTATRYPEAIPLRTINADKISDALIAFCSRYGLPKTIQSDQGSNFTSKLFNQVLKKLGIQHATSTAYHPQSQGALERYHQTLKTMLRTYCFENTEDWDRGIPFALFATRETVQESLGFSPFELVFGHSVRGPLKLLQETLLNSDEETGLVAYVEQFSNRIYHAFNHVKDNLLQAQKRMKGYYDVKARSRCFHPGDKVLMLTQLSGQPLSAKYTGPYQVLDKISDVTYLVKTPDRRKTQRLCHINMLKPYVVREEQTDIRPVSAIKTVETPPPKFKKTIIESKLQNTEALKNLNDKLAHLDSGEQTSIKGLIYDHVNLFSDVPNKTTLVTHDVVLKDDNVKPVKQHPYRVNPIQLEHIRKEIDYMLSNDIITHSNSDWSSPCVLVPKSDGSLRFCVDYRKLNQVTKTDSYPIPRIDDLIDRVSTANYVTKIDLLTAYFQIPLTDRAQEVSTFVTPDGLYKFKVMPFGMVNAPASFQRLINTIIHDIPQCHAYLDDIVVFSNNFNDHLHQLKLLFQKLKQANLTINLVKSQFCHAEIEYLGHVVGNGKVKPVNAKVKAIQEFPVPKTQKQLRGFLGMAGYYRKFCKNFSIITCPLTNLLRKKNQFKWTQECDQAFNDIKDILTKAPVLVSPDYTKPFRITVDSCNTGMGAVISQIGDDSLEHPISFCSKKFNPHEVNYSTIEQELLGLIQALKHFNYYVNGSQFPIEIFTDHNPLVFLSRIKQNQRILRWSLFIQAYNLKITHLSGKDNIVADTLSRM